MPRLTFANPTGCREPASNAFTIERRTHGLRTFSDRSPPNDLVIAERAGVAAAEEIGAASKSIKAAEAGDVLATTSSSADKMVGGLKMTTTVANHATDIITKGTSKGELARPFLSSPLVIQEIMAAKEAIPDPSGIVGALRWEVPDMFRGADGTWELVTDGDTILHFNFVGE
jgi:hypothetical protein